MEFIAIILVIYAFIVLITRIVKKRHKKQVLRYYGISHKKRSS